MDKHLTIIGIVNITFGIVLFVLGIIIFTAVTGGGLLSGDSEAIFITSIVGSAIGIFFTLLSIPGIIGGIGLLQHKRWARILMLIKSILDLLNIPIGTVIGVYTIWVLMQDETIALLT